MTEPSMETLKGRDVSGEYIQQNITLSEWESSDEIHKLVGWFASESSAVLEKIDIYTDNAGPKKVSSTGTFNEVIRKLFAASMKPEKDMELYLFGNNTKTGNTIRVGWDVCTK